MTINEAFEQLGKYLNNKQFDAVLQLCENIINAGYSYPEVYQTMLLAEAKVTSITDLQNVMMPLEQCPSYKIACDVSEPQMREYIVRCNEDAIRKAQKENFIKPSFLNITDNTNLQQEETPLFSEENEDIIFYSGLPKMIWQTKYVMYKVATTYHDGQNMLIDRQNCENISVWIKKGWPDINVIAQRYLDVLNKRISGNYENNLCLCCGENTNNNKLICNECEDDYADSLIANNEVVHIISVTIAGRKFERVYTMCSYKKIKEYEENLDEIVSQYKDYVDNSYIYAELISGVKGQLILLYVDKIIMFDAFGTNMYGDVKFWSKNELAPYMYIAYAGENLHITKSSDERSIELHVGATYTSLNLTFDGFVDMYRKHNVKWNIYEREQNLSERYQLIDTSLFLKKGLGVVQDGHLEKSPCTHEFYTTQIINEKESTGGYSFGKGLAGAALFGPIGAVAGIGGQTKRVQYLLNTCSQCGYQWKQF